MGCACFIIAGDSNGLFYQYINDETQLRIDGPFDSSWPLLVRLGITESIGANINLLILFGPILAMMMNVFQVVTIDKRFTKDHFHIHVRIRKRWFPIVVAAFCTLVMGVLLLYLFADNWLTG